MTDTEQKNSDWRDKVAEIRKLVAKIKKQGGAEWISESAYVHDVTTLLDALDSITATAKALPAERVYTERDFHEKDGTYVGTTTMSEANPDRERLYWYGESGIAADGKVVKVVVDIDAWLAVLDYMTDWTP